MQKIELDVSELPAPEPFEQIMKALMVLSADEYLKVSHRRQPLLLYKPLTENGFKFHVQKGNSHAFDIFIWHQGHEAPEGLQMPSIAKLDNPPETCTED